MERSNFLAIDIGNSRISTGRFNSQKRLERLDFPTNENFIEEINKLIKNADRTLIASVVPAIEEIILKENKASNLQNLTYRDIPLKYRIKNIESTGIDRIINSYSAIKEYNRNAIIIGLGTATIIDAVNSDSEYLGGMILPGVSTMLNSLHTSTAKLPNIDFSPTKNLVGDNTTTAITLGVQLATIGGIKEAIENIKKLLQNPKIIVTGGWAKTFAPLLPFECEINYDLILLGILSLVSKN